MCTLSLKLDHTPLESRDSGTHTSGPTNSEAAAKRRENMLWIQAGPDSSIKELVPSEKLLNLCEPAVAFVKADK